jgi:hypothetical protein
LNTTTDAEIGTGLALELARLDTITWRTAMDRRHYMAAPPTLPNGRQRSWTIDDILPLRLFATLVDIGMPTPQAGAMSNQLAIGLVKDPHAAEQHVYIIRHRSKPAEVRIRSETPPRGEHVMSLPVAAWRRTIRSELRDMWRKQQRSNNEST